MQKTKTIKTLILTSILCLILFTLCACAYSGYEGDHAGAYTLTYTQVPGTKGATRDWFVFRDPQILLLETDSEGRGLYLYYESCESPLSLVIVQRESEDRVYFYPEDSAISFRTPDQIYEIFDEKKTNGELISLREELCSDEALAKFKEENDWNKPIDESRLDSAAITRPGIATYWTDRTGKVITPFLEWRDLMLGLAVKNGHNVPEYYLNGHYGMNIYDIYMATDAYGRELHYVESDYNIYTEDGVYPEGYTSYYLQMLAIINPDGSFDCESFMIELSDICDPDEEMRILKERCGWNQPLN